MPDLGLIILGLIVIPLVLGPIFYYAYALFRVRGARGLAPYLVFAFLLWPVFGYMGAKGFSGVVFLMAVAVLLYMRPIGVPRYTIAGILFLIWIVIAEVLGSASGALFDGNLMQGTFTIDMVSLRFGLILTACALIIAGALKTSGGDSVGALRLARYVSLIVGIGVVVTAILLDPIVRLLTRLELNDYYGTVQELLRNANAFLLLVPLLVAWTWDRIPGVRGKVMSAAITVIALVALSVTGSQAAAVGIILMVGAMLVVYVLPRAGFKVIFGAIAAYILAAPLLFRAGVHFINANGVSLPPSFFSRVKGWEAIGEKIAEKPLVGHGLESTYKWGELFESRPEWLADAVARYGPDMGWAKYEIINSHPHNMALQIWVDTGLIGAVLFAAAVALLGWRLKAPRDWPPVAKYAAAGLTGAALATFSFGYSMWNEAFWAGVAIVAATIVLQARRDDPREDVSA